MKLLETFGPLLRQVAPTIATALGGPVAGMAVRALSVGLLGREDGTANDLAAVLAAATPMFLTTIPEPSIVSLLACSLPLLGWVRRRFTKS